MGEDSKDPDLQADVLSEDILVPDNLKLGSWESGHGSVGSSI